MDGCLFTSTFLFLLYAIEVGRNVRKERKLMKLIMRACAKGDLQAVRESLPQIEVDGSHHQLLLGKKDPSLGNGGTFLHEAAASGSVTLITWLLDHGAEIEAKDATDMTPLHVACLFANLAAVKCLVERGADVKAEDVTEQTPLMLAKCSSMPESDSVVQYLQAREQAADVMEVAMETRELPSGVKVPDEFYCPLTLEIMRDPVVAEDGMSYERSAIMAWVKTPTKNVLYSPLLHTPMGPTVRPNITLRKLIQDFISSCYSNTAAETKEEVDS